MSEKTDTIEYLEELKDEFHPSTDEYADISQTIHYVKMYR